MVTLKPGDEAPSFTGTDHEGRNISLADFRGNKLVLYFFPEAGSPTCTIESCNLRDHYPALLLKGYEVLGVSPDDPEKQNRFARKHDLPFRLIADSGNRIAKAYGVWDKKKLFGHEYMGIRRTTFLIDEKGKIAGIFTRPKNKAHAAEILAFG
ncbi:MAG TPA: thioredoxin-dependent thiol peroxidase [Chitinophagaceae bacterium]|nr:thioredoxin-dependent thiol peroxidase [Chitinophagaceae bacterium]